MGPQGSPGSYQGFSSKNAWGAYLGQEHALREQFGYILWQDDMPAGSSNRQSRIKQVSVVAHCSALKRARATVNAPLQGFESIFRQLRTSLLLAGSVWGRRATYKAVPVLIDIVVVFLRVLDLVGWHVACWSFRSESVLPNVMLLREAVDVR